MTPLASSAVTAATAPTPSASKIPSSPKISTRLLVRPVVDSRPAPDSRPGLTPMPRNEQPVAGLFDVALVERGSPPRTARERCRLLVLPGSMGPRPDLPDPLGWCRTLAPALLEVVQRRRPAHQLARWLDEQVLAALAVQLRLQQRIATPPPRGQIQALWVQCPTDSSAEASVLVRLPHRVAVFAFGLRARGGARWWCSALDLTDTALLGSVG